LPSFPHSLRQSLQKKKKRLVERRRRRRRNDEEEKEEKRRERPHSKFQNALSEKNGANWGRTIARQTTYRKFFKEPTA
jgi:hypothetical protein